MNKEVEQIDQGFVCGRDKTVDFVAFSVKYGCWTYNDTTSGWSESDIPTMHVDSDAKGNGRITQVSINTKGSVRWVLAINTEEIEDFEFKGTGFILTSIFVVCLYIFLYASINCSFFVISCVSKWFYYDQSSMEKDHIVLKSCIMEINVSTA